MLASLDLLYNFVINIDTLGKNRYLCDFHSFTKGKFRVFEISNVKFTRLLLECTDVCRNRYELPVSPVIMRNKASFSRAFIAYTNVLSPRLFMLRYKIRRNSTVPFSFPPSKKKNPFAADSIAREI